MKKNLMITEVAYDRLCLKLDKNRKKQAKLNSDILDTREDVLYSSKIEEILNLRFEEDEILREMKSAYPDFSTQK